jgi:hypothetical protein
VTEIPSINWGLKELFTGRFRSWGASKKTNEIWKLFELFFKKEFIFRRYSN